MLLLCNTKAAATITANPGSLVSRDDTDLESRGRVNLEEFLRVDKHVVLQKNKQRKRDQHKDYYRQQTAPADVQAASACAIGRAALYGPAAAGAEGAHKVMSIFADELQRAMRLAGVARIDQAGPDTLAPPDAQWRSG